MIRKLLASLAFFILFADTYALASYEPADSVSGSSTADKLIEEAVRYLHKPYRSGGKGPGSFDCSGFSHFIYNKFGYNLSASSREQIHDGRKIEGGVDSLKKGDLVFFASRRDISRVGHVGIYVEPLGHGNFRFIHAATHGGIIFSTLQEPYYDSRYVGARRILPEEEIESKPVVKEESIVRQDETEEDDQPVYYTIKSGDTLSKIAKRNHTTIGELCRLNGISQTSVLRIGKKLRIR